MSGVERGSYIICPDASLAPSIWACVWSAGRLDFELATTVGLAGDHWQIASDASVCLLPTFAPIKLCCRCFEPQNCLLVSLQAEAFGCDNLKDLYEDDEDFSEVKQACKYGKSRKVFHFQDALLF